MLANWYLMTKDNFPNWRLTELAQALLDGHIKPDERIVVAHALARAWLDKCSSFKNDSKQQLHDAGLQ
jgi:hypothetical protein